jgi:peptidyl-tRNA hydrolase
LEYQKRVDDIKNLKIVIEAIRVVILRKIVWQLSDSRLKNAIEQILEETIKKIVIEIERKQYLFKLSPLIAIAESRDGLLKPSWIQKELGCSKTDSNSIIKILINSGVLEKAEDGWSRLKHGYKEKVIYFKEEFCETGE